MQQGDLRFPGLSCFPADSEAELLLRETNTALQVLALLLFERLCVFAGLCFLARPSITIVPIKGWPAFQRANSLAGIFGNHFHQSFSK